MNLSSLPLPSPVLDLLDSKGYRELYPPQAEAIKSRVLEGAKILLASPTASGKTLVALMAAAKTVLQDGGKVVYLTPLRALANEKFEEFRMLEALRKPDGGSVKVLISTGDYDASGESLGVGDILVLTNEKFDSVLRHGVSWLDSVKLFVVDEVHLVGSPDRGPTIEMVIAKVLNYASSSQILALSATITNSKELSKWLDAQLVDIRWRPVKLLEGVYSYGEVRFTDGSARRIEPSNAGGALDLAIDTVSEGGQSLIFLETRRRAVSIAVKASQLTRRFISQDEADGLAELSKRILNSGEETGLSRVLADVVARGSAFHHAGLYSEHRRVVEDGFRSGLIKILTATPTLAAGVNLPARRVVIGSLVRYDSDYGGQLPISILEYKQMCGRAGRPQYDTYGEAVLIASSSLEAEELIEMYIKGQPEAIRSQLSREEALRTHLLAVISSFPGLSDSDLTELFSKTLLSKQYRKVTVQSKLKKSIEHLVDIGLVERRGRRYLATEFGKRISLLYIDPETGVIFRRALQLAEAGKKYSLGLLHLIVSTPDFSPKFPLRGRDWEAAVSLVEEYRDEFILPIPDETDSEFYDSFIRDMRSLMVLKAWIDEWTEDRILEQLGVEPGDLHRAVETSEWLIHSLYEIGKLLGKADILAEVNELRWRVKYGIKPELVPLVSLEGVGRVRARSLYSSGFTDLGKLASASLERIASVPKIGRAVAERIREQLTSR